MNEELIRLIEQLLIQQLAPIHDKLAGMEHKLNLLESKLDSFQQDQEVTNKLLTGDTAGIKSQVRDLSKDSREFRRDVREWQLSTNRRIDNLEEKLTDMRDALQ